MWTSTGGGVVKAIWLAGVGGQNPFFVDVINGWPPSNVTMFP